MSFPEWSQNLLAQCYPHGLPEVIGDALIIASVAIVYQFVKYLREFDWGP